MSKKYTIQRSPFIGGKLIKEYFRNTTNKNSELSIAHICIPVGWSEPFQIPKFEEYPFM